MALHGRSFPNRAVPEDLSASYPEPIAGLLNIGVLHTSAEDPGSHATYAPCSIQALRAKGYHYWALGHIHHRNILSEAPDPWIVFPGNTQGRHPNETGPKGCTLVEVRDRAIVAVSPRPLDVLRWAQLRVPLDGVADVAGLAEKFRAAMDAEWSKADGNPLIARLTLTGTTSLHAQISADPETIAAECRNAAIGVSENLFVESVRIETKSPPESAGVADALAQLHDAFFGALDDPALSARLLAEFQALAGQIPRSARPPEISVPRDASEIQALLPEAWDALAHALAADRPA